VGRDWQWHFEWALSVGGDTWDMSRNWRRENGHKLLICASDMALTPVSCYMKEIIANPIKMLILLIMIYK